MHSFKTMMSGLFVLLALLLAVPAEAARRSLRVDFGDEWGGFPAAECDAAQVSGNLFRWRGYVFSGYAPLVPGNTNCQNSTALSASQLFDDDYGPIRAIMRAGETISAMRAGFYSTTGDFCCSGQSEQGFQWVFFSFDDAVVVGLFGPVSDVDNLDVDAATTSLRSSAGVTLWDGANFNDEWLCFRRDGTFLGAFPGESLANCRGGLETASRSPLLVGLPDLNANGAGELAVIGNSGPFVAELRDGASGAVLAEIPILTAGYRIAGAISVPDSDADGKPELVVMAERKSDGRGSFLVYDLPVPDTVRRQDISVSYRVLDLVSVGDADSNGVRDVGVLARRVSDDRGEILTRNLRGLAAGGRTILASTGEALKIRRVPDADSDGTDEYAVLLRRRSDGRSMVQLADGAPPFADARLFFSAGRFPVDLAVLPASAAFSSPQLVVLMSRGAAFPHVIEFRSASGLTGVFRANVMTGHAVIALRPVADVDGLGNPGIALLGVRHADGVPRVEARDVPGTPAVRATPFMATFEALGLEVVESLDANAAPELAVLQRKSSDATLRVALRNATGTAGVRAIKFTP